MSGPLAHGGRETRIDIGVCTYRRPHLAQTLRSLAALELPPHATVRIIVADNDETPSARKLVYAAAAALPFETLYVHCPAANISLARNACVDAAGGAFLAFIDDDSTASPAWLAELLKIAETSGADAVLGPVRAVYSNSAPGWMRRGDFHSTAPVRVDGEIRTGYSGNVLLRRASSHVAGRHFNLALGVTGGEDTEFFTHLHQGGGMIAYAPDAVAHEPVTEQRACFSWLAKRRFRSGQTHGRLLAATSTGGLPSQLALAAAKAACCFGASAAMVALPRHRNRQALRGMLHAGVVSGLLGVREIELYRDASVGRHGHAA